MTFHDAALGASPIGSAALRAAARAGALGRAIRSRLAAIVPAGATVAGVSPTILAARIRVSDATQRDAIAAALSQDPGIASVASNHLIWRDETPLFAYKPSGAGTTMTPNNPLYPFQSWHYGLVDLPRAWAITTGSPSVLVAVVDDGIRFDHPAIARNLTTDGYDFVNNTDSLSLCAGGKISNADDGNGYDPDPTDPASYSLDSTGTCFIPDTLGNHGLHVAGTIGAVGNNGIGVTGVNWAVRIRPVRVLGVGGFGSSYDVAQGVLYAAGLPADNGAGGTVQAPGGIARIINLSLGSSQGDTTLQRAVLSATQAGALIVAAAGNEGTATPVYPAAYPGVLAVAAVGPDGAPAPYSNYGSFVGIRAPGGNFALGDATSGVLSTIWNFATSSPEYAFAEGTSMATPHVSGVAALLISQTPSLGASGLVSQLTTYAVGPATAYGAGLLNAYNSLTARHGPASQLYARLYAMSTGAIVQTIPAPNGAFHFTSVEDGSYLVFAGGDESGDGAVGSPGRVWGAYGGSATPAAVTVLGAVANPLSFSIGFPLGSLTNHAIATATPLVIGGYLQGHIVDSLTADYYKVIVPAAATYTFETSGWVGACGLALEEATAIGLFSDADTLLTFTGYIDPAQYNYCSRLTLNLNPGTYYIGVAGFFGRRYRLQARVGP